MASSLLATLSHCLLLSSHCSSCAELRLLVRNQRFANSQPQSTISNLQSKIPAPIRSAKISKKGTLIPPLHSVSPYYSLPSALAPELFLLLFLRNNSLINLSPLSKYKVFGEGSGVGHLFPKTNTLSSPSRSTLEGQICRSFRKKARATPHMEGKHSFSIRFFPKNESPTAPP